MYRAKRCTYTHLYEEPPKTRTLLHYSAAPVVAGQFLRRNQVQRHAHLAADRRAPVARGQIKSSIPRLIDLPKAVRARSAQTRIMFLGRVDRPRCCAQNTHARTESTSTPCITIVTSCSSLLGVTSWAPCCPRCLHARVTCACGRVTCTCGFSASTQQQIDLPTSLSLSLRHGKQETLPLAYSRDTGVTPVRVGVHSSAVIIRRHASLFTRSNRSPHRARRCRGFVATHSAHTPARWLTQSRAPTPPCCRTRR